MNYKTTFFLAIVGILLLAFFVFVEPRLKGTEGKEAAVPTLFTSDQLKDVTQMVIKKKDGEIICQKTTKDKGQIWMLTKPVTAKANRTLIDNIIRDLQSLDKRDVIKKEPHKTLNLASYGLDNPVLVADVVSAEKKYTLKWGKASTFRPQCVYVQLEGDDAIYAVYQTALDELSKDVKDFRDVQIFEYDNASIVKIKFAEKFLLGQGQVKYDEAELVRQEDGWYVEKPFKEKLDESQVYRLLQGLKDLRAKEFIPLARRNLQEFGLGTPRVKIQLFMKGQDKPQEIHLSEVFQAANGCYLYSTGQEEVVALDPQAYSTLPTTIDSFRSTVIFDFTTKELQEVAINTKLGEMILQREEHEVEKEVEKDGKKVKQKVKEEHWVLKKPENTLADESRVDTFLNRLLALQIDSFYSRNPEGDVGVYKTYGLTEPLCTLAVILKRSDGKAENRRYLWSIRGGSSELAFFKRDNDAQVYAIKREGLDMLMRAELNFLDTTVWNIPQSRIKGFEVEVVQEIVGAGEVKARYKCQWDDKMQKWTLDIRDKELDERRLQDLLYQICFVKTLQWLSKDPDYAMQEFKKPFVTLVVHYEKEEAGKVMMADKELHIIISKSGRYEGRLQGGALAFMVAPSLVNVLREGVHKQIVVPEEHHH